MAFKASFKTAHHQHMILVDATLVAAVNVGDLVLYNPTTKALTAATAAADVSEATAAIIAQSDISLATLDGSGKIAGPYKHVKVEDKDLQFDGAVAASATAKKVSLFKVTDVTDVVVTEYTTVEQLV